MENIQKYSILVVDDDVLLNSMICKYLEKQGFSNIRSYFSGDELLNEIGSYKFPIIIQDYDLPDINGVEILKKVKTANPQAEFIFLSGQNSIEVAVDAIKFGAFDYIIKDNFAKENVVTKIRNLIKIKKLISEKSVFKSLLISLIIALTISWIYVFFRFFF